MENVNRLVLKEIQYREEKAFIEAMGFQEQANIGRDVWDYINVWNRNKRRRELESKRTSENVLRQNNRARNRRQRKARRIERLNRK